ncbi:MAG: CHAP domain-containing protein [Gammaproteobacteria bacterium]|nr:CHAP domain-containing protein [Gammaproteobacteria bacterium]
MKRVSNCIYLCLSLFAVSTVSAQTPQCGVQLSPSSIWNGVAALSNGIYQRGQNDGGSCGGRGQYGLQYQCVEYIVKNAAQRGYDVKPWLWTDAVTFFDESKSNKLGMVRIVNGDPNTVSPPHPGDIIVFSVTPKNPYGHIAMVSNVSGDGNTVTIVEQNWSDTGIATLTRKVGTGARYELNPRSGYKVLGWLRKPASFYEQPPGHFGGFSSGGQITVADEFQLGQPALIQNISWWGGYQSTHLSTPVADDFTIRLFSDEAGKPGALIQTFLVGNNAQRATTGDFINPPDPETGFEGRVEFKYSFSLPRPFLANANTRYWLSIVNVPVSDSWVWEVSGSLNTPGVQRSFQSGLWLPYFFDNTAFQLHY